MSEEPVPRLPARARPVAELRLDGLVERADELAQRWAVALVLARPLDGIGGVPLEDIAREGPALCTQTLRALQSDAELDRLTGAGAATGREQSAPARRLGAIAGATDAVGAIAAVEALRGVLWEGLLEEVRMPAGGRSASRQLGDLSDRLAHVCACALAASLAARRLPTTPPEHTGREAVAASFLEQGAPSFGAEQAVRSPVLIIDEHAGDVAPTPAHAAARESERPQVDEHELRTPALAVPERPLSWDESPPVPPATRGAEIEIRDERGEEGATAWIVSIGSQLERYRQDGVAFAVLLVEPVEIDRLRRVESPAELERVTGELEQALQAAWPGSLTRQHAGRYWLLATAANGRRARDLAGRLREDVARVVMYRSAPLALAVGSASCPEDGEEASVLAAHADVGLYAARSAARGNAPTTIDEHAQP